MIAIRVVLPPHKSLWIYIAGIAILRYTKPLIEEDEYERFSQQTSPFHARHYRRGWGAQLQMNGLYAGDCAEEWNITYLNIVHSIAGDYVHAGSKVILTNTFGANRILLSKYGLESKTTDIVKRGVNISLKAAETKAMVLASIGPTGKLVSIVEISSEQTEDIIKEQIFAAADAGAQEIVVETMSDIEEAAIAAQVAVQTGFPVVSSKLLMQEASHCGVPMHFFFHLIKI